MAREFFKNLPNTTTPLTAPRMNALLDGDEAMGNIVVDSIRGKNLFNINGEINVQGNNGNIVSGNSSSNNILTTNVNGATSHAAGQKFTNLNGKTFTVSAKCVSNGTGSGCNLVIYDNNTQKTYKVITNGNTDNITYTGTSNNIVIGFSTVSGTGAQMTDIQVEIGSSKTDYAPYQGIGYVSGQNSNGNYVKYDDGTLIQWSTVAKSNFQSTSAVSTTVQGINWYRSNNPSIVFPTTFIDTNYSINLTILEGTSGSRFVVPETLSKTTAGFVAQLMGIEDFTSSGTAYTNLTSVSYIAIGRWKW